MKADEEGYNAAWQVRSPNEYYGIKDWKYQKLCYARARHENMNGRIKERKCLGSMFRHDHENHCMISMYCLI